MLKFSSQNCLKNKHIIPFAIPILMLALPEIRGYISSGWVHNEWGRSPFYILLTLVHGVSIPIAIAAFFAVIIKPFDRPITLSSQNYLYFQYQYLRQ